MFRGKTIGVVIPAYNEERFVVAVIKTVPDFVDRIYVIDDGSTDGTWAVIQTYAEKVDEADRWSETEAEDRGTEPLPADGGVVTFEPRLVPIRHEANRGVGGAIKTGYLRARADGIDVTVVIGGDGQMDPDRMISLIEPVVDGRVDYAKGNRLISREYRRTMSGWRLFGNVLLTFLTKMASGYWKMVDPQNGYTAISKHALETVDIEHLYEFYGYCNDLLVRLNARDMRIADVAMPAVYGDERSHIRYTTYIPRVSWLLLRGFIWRLRVRYLVLDFHPLALFYLLGIVITTLGLLGGVWSVYLKIARNEPLFVPASLSLAIVTLGSLLVLFAMLFDMQANEDRELELADRP